MSQRLIGRHPLSTVSVSGYQTTRECAARELRRMRYWQRQGIIRIYKIEIPGAVRQYVSCYRQPRVYHSHITDRSNRTFDQVTVT